MNDHETGPRDPLLFLGREEELRQVVENLRLGRHTLLIGAKGIGKTALMQQALAILEGRVRPLELSARIARLRTGRLVKNSSANSDRLLFVTHVSPLGDCLRELMEHLWRKGDLQLPDELSGVSEWDKIKKYFTSRGRVGQEELITKSLAASHSRYTIFLDSLDRVSPAHQGFLEKLFEVAVLCAAVVITKEAYHFKKVWASFSHVELGPLPQEVCRDLVQRLIRTQNLHVADHEMYEREILKSANGNPFHIRNLIWINSRQRHLSCSDIRSLRRVEEGEYFNMGPIYIFGASAFTLFKIFSLGMDNREFYIYFSALGFLVYLTFRVFRSFFLFRPQKYRN